MKIPIRDLNQLDQPTFVAICGGFFEHSPWIAEQAWLARPFQSLDHLHQTMCDIVSNLSQEQQLTLIRAHPDLVGRLAREGRLTASSTAEQAAAGLTELSPIEAEAFDRYNAKYQSRFGFPFVICARQNKKEAILAAFPVRLQNDRNQEMSTALSEIYKIARLRLMDAVSESACPQN
jgi:OHCU decarboxylase